MEVHEFFKKYANVPLSLRFTAISYKDGGDMTLSDVYKEMSQLEDTMRPMRIRQTELMKLAAIILDRLHKWRDL